MTRILLAAGALLAMAAPALAAAPTAEPIQDEPLRFASCAELRDYLDARLPYEHVRLATAVYECQEPVNPSVDGLSIDFNGSLIRVADQALRPGIVLGDLHTPARRRYTGITVRNLEVDGNRTNQAFECWGGPCDPNVNQNPFWQQRVNGVTVNGCDDCALVDIRVSAARSGGVVVVGSRRLVIDGLEATGSHFDGLAGYFTYDSLFRNVRVHHNDYSGLSFDLDFSRNRIEGFDASENGDHGIFIRYATNNTFAHGKVTANVEHGVYFDQARRDAPATCAIETRFVDVRVSNSGKAGAWLNFACEGNAFEASAFVGNGTRCFDGLHAELIGRRDTLCTDAEPESTAEANAGTGREG